MKQNNKSLIDVRFSGVVFPTVLLRSNIADNN